MHDKQKAPHVPREAADTIRHAIVAELLEGPASAHDISVSIRISEREVAGHLEHIRKTIALKKLRLVVTPATCRACGFVFLKRDRLTRPGKCPVCKGESISSPLFTIDAAG